MPAHLSLDPWGKAGNSLGNACGGGDQGMLTGNPAPTLPPSHRGLGKLNELMLIKCFQIIR